MKQIVLRINDRIDHIAELQFENQNAEDGVGDIASDTENKDEDLSDIFGSFDDDYDDEKTASEDSDDAHDEQSAPKLSEEELPTLESYIIEMGQSPDVTLFVFYCDDDSDDKYVLMQEDSGKAWVWPELAGCNYIPQADGSVKVDIDINLNATDGRNNRAGVNDVNRKNADQSKKHEIKTSDDRLQLKVAIVNRGENGVYKVYMRAPMAIRTTDYVDIYVNLSCGDYSAKLRLGWTKKPNICDAVLDFGSEASQMAMFLRSEQIVPDTSDVFRYMHEILKTDNTRAEDYLQYESRKLYKSIFYAKSEIGDREDANPVGVVDNDLLKMLTTAMESQNLLSPQSENQVKYVRVPNIKFSQFGAVPEPRINGARLSNFKDNFFYRVALNTFVYCILRNAGNDVHAVNLQVLMPNVFDYLHTLRNINTLRADIYEMIRCNPELRHIKCVELTSLSESDASILGLMAWALTVNKPMRQDTPTTGRYLILDAGKGTLDYSIMDVDAGKKTYKNVYRGGIIGAGSALTCGYLMALLYDYVRTRVNVSGTVDDNMIISLMYTKIVGAGDNDNVEDIANLASLGKLMKAVDEYKVAANSTPKSPEKQSQSRKVNDFNLEDFITFVGERYEKNKSHIDLSKNAWKYVERVIDNICIDVCYDISSVIEGLKPDADGKVINKVIFAGRSFNDKLLKSKMKDALSFILGDGKTKRADDFVLEYMKYARIANFNKKVCLYPITILLGGRYSSQNANVFKNLSENSDDSNTEDGGWTSIFRRLPFGRSSGNSTSQFTRGLFETYKNPQRFKSVENSTVGYLATGIKLDNVNQSDVILIGGDLYELPDGVTGDCELFFLPSGVTIRTNGETREIQSQRMNFASSPLASATLFPYIYDMDYTGFSNDILDLLRDREVLETPKDDETAIDNSQQDQGPSNDIDEVLVQL